MNKSNKAKPNGIEEPFDTVDEDTVDEETVDEETVDEETVTEAAEETKEAEEELEVRFLRLAADFQNYKRRVVKEKSDIYAYANESLMVELLEVIDNFDRALEADCTDKGMLEGMKMILKQFKGVLEKNGLEGIEAQGQEFDPNFHHAVMMESVENCKSGEITEVIQKGYMLNKKVIRPAMVKVAE